jgi:hypothetical protein
MPYLRLYSLDLPIDQKRGIAQKLIEITMRTFHLRADERFRTTIQFITLPEVGEVDGLRHDIPSDADCTLEVMGHDLTEEKKRAFAEEAAVVLTHLVPVKLWSRIARLLGIEADTPQRIAFQFNELSAAIGDPFVVDPAARSVFFASALPSGVQIGREAAGGFHKSAA